MTARVGTIVSSTNAGSLQFGDRVNEVQYLVIETDATVDAADTLAVNFAKFGITTVDAVFGFKHTTDNQVIVTENPTTLVSDSQLVLTYPSGTNNDKRVTVIYYR